MDNGLSVQSLQIRIGLSRTDKDNGLTGNISHRYGRSNLVINSIKLGKNNSVDQVRILLLRVISKSSIKLNKLVNSFITDKRFSDEQNKIRSIY